MKPALLLNSTVCDSSSLDRTFDDSLESPGVGPALNAVIIRKTSSRGGVNQDVVRSELH